MTQLDVAKEMEWSPTKVIRIEKGEIALSPVRHMNVDRETRRHPALVDPGPKP